jgi:hypothetical protein
MLKLVVHVHQQFSMFYQLIYDLFTCARSSSRWHFTSARNEYKRELSHSRFRCRERISAYPFTGYKATSLHGTQKNVCVFFKQPSSGHYSYPSLMTSQLFSPIMFNTSNMRVYPQAVCLIQSNPLQYELATAHKKSRGDVRGRWRKLLNKELRNLLLFFFFFSSFYNLRSLTSTHSELTSEAMNHLDISRQLFGGRPPHRKASLYIGRYKTEDKHGHPCILRVKFEQLPNSSALR